ncbi:hypothetical protein [Nocardioides sp.]|uniref:hypothetical protein n=1 Tax=Nocardioides sp. TaxID=35761 RepID=UPI00286ADD92|nr:hypothetical protein [Nocardioides sp.]
MTRHRFAFAVAYRAPALLFAITPRTAWVDLDDAHLAVRYGPWSLRTPLTNVTGVERTGGFGWLKTAGPPHLSFSDRGISFTTNGDDAACVSFATPVAGIDPTTIIKHPGATLTLQDVPGFIAELERHLAG